LVNRVIVVGRTWVKKDDTIELQPFGAVDRRDDERCGRLISKLVGDNPKHDPFVQVVQVKISTCLALNAFEYAPRTSSLNRQPLTEILGATKEARPPDLG
jgi:hypothetical protein